jgi:alkane 1-monooxygenase
MNGLRFLLALLLIIGPWHWFQKGLPWMTLLLVYAVLPLLDALIGPRPSWSAPAASTNAQRSWVAWLPRVTVPGLYALVIWGVSVAPELSPAALLLLAASVGTATGGIGITAAHEMGHRPGRLDRGLAQIGLALVGYGHFYIEHNRGHHVRIGTRDDPATARFGENVYAFWVRSLHGSFAHALKLEVMRREHRGLSVLHDRVWQLTALSAAYAALACVLAGWAGLVFWVLQALIAVLLLETTNYLEHYGLTRERGHPVAHAHSWDGDQWLSNAFLFNLERHADHHAHPERPFEALRATPAAPQLPYGYATMVLLAWVPPLWRAVMHPRLAKVQTAASVTPAVSGGVAD